ncbi:hypothetical protein K6Y31_06320 [Motilimonas cestriensis]|uniref:Zinc ribbon domain-containing protein n=1 Tax=Motilimonas cestriensis TaxID=2742685 RepID=A0ABS8WAK3_9GAMM|nr:hypothetical protein [Motilimonas cestriensis]MCE2594425.1 hypothetical protein [Motilimonas cestriensis]
MSELTCPHCHNSVPRGATVCSGCQAEVEYGSPQAMFIIILIIAAAAGIKVGIWFSSASWLGWVVAVAVVIGGMVVSGRLFKDRVNFKRVYKTR